jgi:hypothetical protein
MSKKPPKKPRVTQTRPAGADHAVVTVEGGRRDVYRREPCPQCPWRKDAVGVFPAEAFRHSAPCCYDAAFTTFACHDSGIGKPATCAGFLLKNSMHNILVRMRESDGLVDISQITAGGVELFDSYREMAIANGVDPDDPVIAPCRADND